MNLENDKIIQLLKQENKKIYLVGGVIRDYIMGKTTHDKDIIILDEEAKSFAKRFSEKHNSKLVTLDEENNIYRVCMPDKINYIDITNPINDSLESDIKRRDLTINSIAMDISNNKYYDPLNGIEDIKNGIIRAIGEENFISDPLRILRAFRFSSTLGFEIEKNTLDFINRNKELMLKPAVERRKTEIIKLFGGKDAHNTLLKMDELNIIEPIFGMMKDVKKIPPNTHHHLDLFHHSIETVRQIQLIYENSSAQVRKHLERADFGGEPRLSHLKLAGFLHDIGKFSTWTIEGDRHRFIGHDVKGAELAQEFLKTQKFSKKQIEYISFLIKHHIYPSSLICAPDVTEKTYMRYIRKANNNSIDLITLAKADRLSAQGVAVTKEMTENNINGLDKLQDFYLEMKPYLKPLPKLLNGNEIMEILNIKPSEKLGEIIDELHRLQVEGVITTKQEAIDFVKKQ